jgi:molecular chaperone GrpE
VAEPGPGAAAQPAAQSATPPAAPAGGGSAGAGGADELAAARAEAAERTADLQRITAEYANYRKRVDRDRTAVVEGATRAVLAALLPVLDDVERARQHGDLTGAFKAVADQLETTLEKLGLQPFGEVGDPFDPMLHEAVAHQGSADVTVPTCVSVLRRGFRHGERLLRPALVAVADPAPDAPPAAEPVAPTDLPAATDAAPPGAPPGPPAAEASAGEPAAGPAGPQQELNEDGTPVAWFGPDGNPERP